jgi:hypothetical protein
MKTIQRITATRGMTSPLIAYVAYDHKALSKPTFKVDDADQLMTCLGSLSDYMPTLHWYWHVATVKSMPGAIRLRRICLVSKACVVPTYDGRVPLLRWAEAFELWQAHVRML